MEAKIQAQRGHPYRSAAARQKHSSSSSNNNNNNNNNDIYRHPPTATTITLAAVLLLCVRACEIWRHLHSMLSAGASVLGLRSMA
jgi:hypothetical protein